MNLFIKCKSIFRENIDTVLGKIIDTDFNFVNLFNTVKGNAAI